MGRRRRGGQGNHGDVPNTERAPSPVSDLPIASLPVPFAESYPTASPTSKIIPFWDKPRIIPFWEKTDNVTKAKGEDNKKDDAGSLSTEDGGRPKEPRQQTPPETTAETVNNTTFTYKMSPNTILEDAGQYALNASISSGRFEDLRILAFSRRISPNRVGAPRAMYANSTLVTRALPSLFQDERLDEVSDAGLALCDDISVSATYYDYGDDSDLDDDKSDGSESSEDETDSESAPSDRKDKDETPENNTQRRPVAKQAAEDAKPTPPTASNNVADPSAAPAAGPAEARSPPVKAEASDSVSVNVTPTTKPETTPGPQVRTGASTPQKPTLKVPDTNARMALYSPSGSEGPRTIFAIDTAYRTWRAVVFYAYTHRIAFSPLRSQGLPYKLADEDDPSQLPICSPKSMYRLAMKYGNTELERLAGDDIASKLSTQNALAELFSPFTARYPQIQDMELNFVVAHLKHPHIAVELPTWIDRFARGELKECAGTFGRLIHKLACAATVSVASDGLNACPRGCAMSTVQHRCTMCGLSFN